MIIGDKKVCNEIISLYDKLALEMSNQEWNSITLCSAFLTKDAANSMIELIDEMNTKSKIKVTFIIGIKNNFTAPDAIRTLLNYIDNCSKRNIEFNLKLPIEIDFHMKCYIFLSKNVCKALVGSANLTGTGLESRGELLVEVNDGQTIDEIVSYVDHYLNESENWHDYINKYETVYEKGRPEIKNVNSISLFNKTGRKKQRHEQTIRFIAPTVDILGKVNKEQEERVIAIFDSAKEHYPDIIKSNWIIFSELDEKEMGMIKKNYPIGSCFDRPRGNNTTWEIGVNRMICYVGAIIDISDDEIVMFMRKGCIHYNVTEEIVNAAEKYGIKSYDEDYIPSKREMDKYKQFILKKRKE